jgi:BON domain
MRHPSWPALRGGVLHGSAAAILIGLAASGGRPCAAEPAPLAAPAQAPASPADWKLSLQARKALQQDKRLEGLNVGLTIHGSVANLWGPVPSADSARFAEECLKKVPGITAVVNGTRVVPPADPLPAQVAEALRAQSLKSESAVTPPATVTTAKMTSNRPPAEALREFAQFVRPMPIDRQSPPDRAPAVLLPPMADGQSTDFDAFWERLRDKDLRFRDVVLESQAGIVRINGSVARMADAWELAEKLAEFPGVKQVVLDKVQPK